MNSVSGSLRPTHLHNKICVRLPRADQLRPDAAVRRHERAVRQARPVASHRAVKRIGARRVDGVFDHVDPLDRQQQDKLAVGRGLLGKGALERRQASMELLMRLAR
eukprot:252190-Chlamydomonas_euryale.AAC.2